MYILVDRFINNVLSIGNSYCNCCRMFKKNYRNQDMCIYKCILVRYCLEMAYTSMFILIAKYVNTYYNTLTLLI